MIEGTKKRSDVAGAILAGGKSSRMGRDKALLELDGKPFIQHIAGMLSQVFEKVFIVSDHSDNYRFLGLPTYEDIIKDGGPLGGIHSALKNARTQRIFVVSCDVPFLKQHIVQQLLDVNSHADVTMFSTNDRAQPLCGIYDARILPELEIHLKQGQFSVSRFIGSLTRDNVPPTSSSSEILHGLLNINTPSEYNDYCLHPDSSCQTPSAFANLNSQCP